MKTLSSIILLWQLVRRRQWEREECTVNIWACTLRFRRFNSKFHTCVLIECIDYFDVYVSFVRKHYNDSYVKQFVTLFFLIRVWLAGGHLSLRASLETTVWRQSAAHARRDVPAIFFFFLRMTRRRLLIFASVSAVSAAYFSVCRRRGSVL